jgi:hypothetical protein
MDPKNWEKIKWIQTPEEIQDAVRKQLADRMIKMLRKVTIQGIKSKILLSEIRNLSNKSSE